MIKDAVSLAFTFVVVVVTFPFFMCGWIIGISFRAFLAGKTHAEKW